MAQPVSGLEAHLGYWLRYVSNAVSGAFAARLAAANVSVAEWVVLRVLFDAGAEGMNASEVAERIGMTRGGISKIVARLEAQSLLDRTVDEADRRRQGLALTRTGRALVPRLAALADANDEAFFGALSSTERKTLDRLLRRLVQAHGLSDVPVE